MKPSTINTILKYLTITALYAVLIVPLVVNSSMFFLFITGKAYTFRIIVEVAFALWLILAFRDRSYIPRRSWILVGVTLFTIIVGIADVAGVEPLKSLSSNYERMEGFVFIFHLFLYFVAAIGVMSQKTDDNGVVHKNSHQHSVKLWAWFAHATLAVSIIMGIKGLIQHFGGGVERIDSYLGNSTYLGVYALIHIFIALFFLIKTLYRTFDEKGRSDIGAIFAAIGYAILALFNFWVMYQTGTRGSLIGFFVGMVFTALMLAIFERKNRIVRAGSSILLILILLSAILLGTLKNTSFVKNHSMLARFSALATLDFKSVVANAGRARFLIWGTALKGVEQRSLLGWGQDNFNYVFSKYYNPAMYDQETWFDRTHNVIFDWLISAGVLGLLSYLALFTALIYSIWKKDEGRAADSPFHFSIADKSILTGLLVAYFFHNLFVFDNLVSYIGFFSIMAFVHGMTARKPLLRSLGTSDKPVFDPIVVDYIVAPVIVIVLGFAIYFVNVPGIRANTALIRALVACNAGKSEPAIQAFKEARAEHAYVGLQEINEQIISCAASALSAGNIPAETQREWTDLAQLTIDEQIKTTPMDARAFYFAGAFYSQLGKFARAAEYFEKSLELTPNKQPIQIQLGLAYLNSGQQEKGIKEFEKAYSTAPNLDASKVGYAAALVFADQDAKAEAIFGATSSVMTDDRVVAIYVNKEKYSKAIELYRIRQAASPNDIRPGLLIAATYFKSGDKQASIRELRSLETKFTQYKPDIEDYVTKIQKNLNPF